MSDAEPQDPVRLRDDPAAPAELRALLRGARPTAGPDAAARAALRARVEGLAAAPPAPAGSLLPWSGAGVVLVAALAVWLARPSEQAAPPPAASIERAPAPAAPPPAPPAPRLEAPAPAPPAAATPTRPSPTPRPAPPRRPAPDGLEAEQALLEAARGALRARPTTALAFLQRHALEFPDGQLAAEREYLAVQALRAMGREEDAAVRRARFLARHPESPYAPLLRADEAR